MLELSHTDYYQTIKSNSLVIISSFVRCINLLTTSEHLMMSPIISKYLQRLPYLARKLEPGGNTWRLSQPPTEQSTAIFFSSVRLAGSHKLQSHTLAVLQFRN